jgi:dCMP deaminase
MNKIPKIDWQNYFLGIAFCVAERSSDSQTKHGTVLVDSKTNQILSVGYNGFPRNCKDDSNLPHVRPLKHKWMVHSECNSIFNCRLKSQDMTAYVTGQCCPNCLLSLYQFGVTTVVMADSHGSFLISEDDLKWEKDFVEQTGIILKKVKPNLDWLTSVVEGRAGEFIQEKNNKLKEEIEKLKKELRPYRENDSWDGMFSTGRH